MLHLIQNRFGAIAFRGSIIAVFALWVFSPIAPAQPVQATKLASITGVYNGTYAGDHGPTKFKLTLTQQDNGTLAGAITLYLADGTATNAYTCDIRGRYIPANRMVQILRGKWQTAPPSGVDMPGMNGVFDPEGGNGVGQISGKMRARPGPAFEAIRDVDESAKMAAAIAANKPAAPPPPVITPQARQPIDPKPAAPPSSLPAPAPVAAGPTAINGVYTGEFKRANDIMKVKLSIKSTDDGSLTALFTFDPPARKEGSSITYKLTGKYVAKSHAYGLASSPFEFTTIEPVDNGAQEALTASKASAVHIGITGPGAIYGSMTGSNPESGEFHIGWISGTMDRAQSTDLDKAMLAQGSGTSTAVPVAPVIHPSFEGVYNGTYADKDGPKKLRLTLWLGRENRTAAGKLVNTEIAGLLTVFVTEGSVTMPYTADVKGFYGGDPNRSVQVTSGRYEPIPPGNFRTTGLQGKLDPASGNSAAQISGFMFDADGSKFQATRDAGESASMDFDRLRKHIRPGIDGVFNGTYTRANASPAKLKLTITHNRDGAQGLAGLATIYLPVDSGTKAYSYDLKGAEDGRGKFHLSVYDWATTPPKDFQNLRSMGFNGTVVINEALTSARIISAPVAGLVASDFVPQFEATWDPTESADIKGTLAAQKAVGAADQVAAMKARDETLKTAPPKQLASKDLVRKSRTYWDSYQTDMIREVFDGGFGAAIDENKEFQEVFCSYVELLSARFPDRLPPNHVRVTNVVRTNRKFDKQTGLLISEENHDYTVDMDPRFVDGYKQCWSSLNSKGEELRGVFAAAQPGGAQRMLFELMAVGKGMQKFFADNGGKSAATRQMNENFLRAINGDPSLQQANGKIDGAQAESDKDLPPGRYARFVDGANAYFRERAKADPIRFGSGSSHDTALCQRLAELYEFGMSREEDYYYANDFEGRFLPIMGPRASCPDPAWPQLHPDVEKAIAEVK